MQMGAIRPPLEILGRFRCVYFSRGEDAKACAALMQERYPNERFSFGEMHGWFTTHISI